MRHFKQKYLKENFEDIWYSVYKLNGMFAYDGE